MRQRLRWLALGLFALWGTAVVAAPEDQAKKPQATCKTYGTSVQFDTTPAAAAKRAEAEEKLVMVLHISGLFEDPDFT
jgi:hypothetical protein